MPSRHKVCCIASAKVAVKHSIFGCQEIIPQRFLFGSHPKTVSAVSQFLDNPYDFFIDNQNYSGVVFAPFCVNPTQFLKVPFFVGLYIHFTSYNGIKQTDNPALKVAYAESVEAFRERGLGFQMKMTDEKPVLVWEFNSMKSLMETIYAFSLADADEPLRMCKHCGKAFFIAHGRSLFCSERCRNQFNVYKHRANARKEGKP